MKTEDIYTRVTTQIIEAIAAGELTYRMPWHVTDAGRFMPMNAVSKRPYRGINVLSLWITAERLGYSSGFWATYQQWKQLGVQVRKGEKAAEVVLWKVGESHSKDEDDEQAGTYLLARGYSVFNADQVNGFDSKNVRQLSDVDRIAAAEGFFRRLPMEVVHGGNEAFYDIETDKVHLPDFRRFRKAAGYYSTLAHESVHWSGAAHRLNRRLGSRFGSMAYAAEELVAELGAAFLGALLQTATEPRKDHAAYVASWLSLLRNDKRAIFTAASQAQKAVDWLCSQSQQTSAAA